MKIKWVTGERLVPFIGLVKNGDVHNVPDLEGRNLIRQGCAVAYSKPRGKKKRKKTSTKE
jgi:hypothetical protein